MVTFNAGDRVCVTRALGEVERQLLGEVLYVRRLDAARGRVVAGNAWGDRHLHPETLELAPDGPHRSM